MRNKLFFIITLLTAWFTQAQLLTEDFSGSDFPPAGWTIDAHADHWIQVNSAEAGGEAPEAIFKWDPSFNGISRLISPEIDLSGINNVYLRFKHHINDYSGGYTVGVATRHGGGSWNIVWSMNGANITETRSIAIDNGDVNQPGFQFCFFFSGNSYNINYWHLDDIELGEMYNTDLSVEKVNLPVIGESGNTNINASLSNMGINTITSFDASYQIDSDTPVNESFSGLNISSLNNYNVTFSTPWNATPGQHTVTVTVSNINGSGDDDNTGNDSASGNANIAYQTTDNFPLYEEFTSSTCSPCASFNSSTMNPFMQAHPDDVAVVKYQMSWPSPGDPYYTEEGGVRRQYYQVNGVPSLFIGGTYNMNPTGGFNQETNRNAYADLDVNFSLDGSTITVNTTITPYVDGEFTLHMAVIEKETTGNTGSNGETSFKHVMMKMLPDAYGTAVNIANGQDYTVTESYDMSSTFVEELSDLAVVVFLQHNDSKFVLQSAYAQYALGVHDETLQHIVLFPNPAADHFTLYNAQGSDMVVFDVQGRKVMQKTGLSENESFDVTRLDQGTYFVNISNDTSSRTIKLLVK